MRVPENELGSVVKNAIVKMLELAGRESYKGDIVLDVRDGLDGELRGGLAEDALYNIVRAVYLWMTGDDGLIKVRTEVDGERRASTSYNLAGDREIDEVVRGFFRNYGEYIRQRARCR